MDLGGCAVVQALMRTLALAGIAMVAWNVFWIAATVRAFARR
jgi:hypothetical protein